MKRENKRSVNSKILHLSLKKWPCFLLDRNQSYIVTPRTQILISKSGLTIEQLLPRQHFKPASIKGSSMISQQQNCQVEQHNEQRRVNMLNILSQMWRQNYQKQSIDRFSKIKKSKTQRKLLPQKLSDPFQTIEYDTKQIKGKYKPSKPSKQRLESRNTDYDSTKSRNTNREGRILSKISSPKLIIQTAKHRNNKILNSDSKQCTNLRDRLLKLMIEWNKYEQKYHKSSLLNQCSRTSQKQHKIVKENFIKESNQLEKKLHNFCPKNKRA